MNADEAFQAFATRFLQTAKAARYGSLLATIKGKQQILASLDHEIETALRPRASVSQDYSSILDRPCFVFHRSRPFGDSIRSVRQTLGELSALEGWMILIDDGSGAVLRPEGRWDAERLILATHS